MALGLAKRKENPSRTTVLTTLLIDDGDLGLGDWGPLIQATSNRQHVIGELMHLADRISNGPGSRVPIILVGNNLNRLYGPLGDRDA